MDVIEEFFDKKPSQKAADKLESLGVTPEEFNEYVKTAGFNVASYITTDIYNQLRWNYIQKSDGMS